MAKKLGILDKFSLVEEVVDGQEIVEHADVPEVPRIPLFGDLSASAFAAVLDEVEMDSYAQGQAIVKEGDRDQTMCLGLALWNGNDPILKELGLLEEAASR